MSDLDDLIAFVRTRLDEDERKIAAMEREEHRAKTAPIFQAHPPDWLAGVDIFVSSKRWRAEVVAKRRLVDLHPYAGLLSAPESCEPCAAHPGPCVTLRLLALPYAGHPDYREEWHSVSGS